MTDPSQAPTDRLTRERELSERITARLIRKEPDVMIEWPGGRRLQMSLGQAHALHEQLGKVIAAEGR